MFRLNRIVFIVFLLLITPRLAHATVYEVGPGQPYASIGAVPLASLQPGDTVRIHYRSTPYQEKWVICRQGTAAQPITFAGVPGPNGELPIIEGNGATTAPGLNYWSENRGVVKIGVPRIRSRTTAVRRRLMLPMPRRSTWKSARTARFVTTCYTMLVMGSLSHRRMAPCRAISLSNATAFTMVATSAASTSTTSIRQQSVSDSKGTFWAS